MSTLDAEKRNIAKAIESRQKTFWKISDAIWSYAELGLEEFKSSKLLADTLQAAGFKVERGVAGMPTAFVATWSHGTGRPVIGFLGEYDALPMLSQKAGSTTKNPVVPGAPGHGCNHHTMCSMQALAVTALQEIMKKKGLDGTLKVFGSPAEEIVVSRPYMVRAGLFKDVDAVIDCHGDFVFKSMYGVEGLALFSFIVTFHGKSAHSGVSPWLGRSATDAVDLMHAGTERMREHLPLTQRSHWIITEGGQAPNVVPHRASTWYYIKDVDENVEDDFKWMLDCAEGAVLMTQTTHEIKVLTAIHQRFHNKALAELLFENIKAVGRPAYTKDEEAYAKALQESVGLPVKGMEYPLELSSPETATYQGGGSDVGDVTLVVPTAGFRFPAGVPGCTHHTWPVVSSGTTSIAHKGITAGAKVAAFSAFDLITNPGTLEKIRSEFEELARVRPYRTFLPEDANPPVGLYAEIMEKYRGAMEKFYINP